MTATSLALPPRYRGSELIATGGMADVYAATDEMLGRRVAIKVLAERFARDPDLRARFTREARIAARLSNEPNVVTIFDVAEVDDRPAIVMEYMPGGTVADRMRDGRVSPALALSWLADAGRALDAAHAQGVIHRDVKPANLMLGGDGDVRMTDFGIARIAGDVSLTSAGTILGTSGYMSPEQAVGGKATAASDRYGLAVVAFELLTGRRPYVGETFASEAAAHATAPIPSATALDAALPPAIDRVFEQGLAKEPLDRFRSCGGLVSGLRSAFADAAATTMRVMPATAETSRDPAPASVPAGPPRAAPAVRVHRGTRRRNTILLAALAVVATLGVAIAVLATRDDGSSNEAVTVVRTATVAGTQQVRTVTVQSEEPAVPPATTTADAPTPTASGASLNDRGYQLLQGGNATAALPLLEQAVSKLEGTGSLTEAYASYNLAWARFVTGSCDGVKELLDRSKQIQGKRKEIDRLKHDVNKGCKGD